MNSKETSKNKRDLYSISFIFNIFGICLFISATSIAMYYFPGGYLYFGNYFSDLGMEIAWNGENNQTSRLLFHLAIIILSILCVINAFAWNSLISRKIIKKDEKNLIIIGSLSLLISAFFLAGIAIFPKKALDPIVNPHSITTTIYFLMILLPMLCFYLISIKNQFTKNYCLPGFFYNIFLLLYIATPLLLPEWVYLPMNIFKPMVQKFLIFSLLAWMASFSLWLRRQGSQGKNQ